jgi:uronate dehydrogenase
VLVPSRRRVSLPPTALLVTGAAGGVATAVRATLRREFSDIRLTDRRRPRQLARGERFVPAELADPAAVDRAVRGVSAIVHFGGIASDGTLSALAPSNVAGVDHLLDAAIRHRVRRVVLASSMHVCGKYARDEPVTAASPPRPDSCYAVTKLYAETRARSASTNAGLSVVVLRLGHVIGRREHAEPDNWLHPTDLARLLCVAVRAPDIGYECWHVVTDGDAAAESRAMLRERFGFAFTVVAPLDAVARAAALRWWYPDDPIARQYRGGVFASGRATVPSR